MNTKKKIYITCGIMLGTLITSSITGFAIKHFAFDKKETTNKDDKTSNETKMKEE